MFKEARMRWICGGWIGLLGCASPATEQTDESPPAVAVTESVDPEVVAIESVPPAVESSTAVRVRVEEPALPSRPHALEERTLYALEAADVYASDEGVAEEVAELAVDAAARFEQVTGRRASRALIIAIDEDEPPPADVELWYRSTVFARRLIDDKPRPSGEELEAEYRRMSEEAREGPGLESPAVLLGLMTGWLPPEESAELSVDLAGAEVHLVPTAARMGDAFSEMLGIAMDAEEVPIAKRLLVATVMPLVKSRLASQGADNTRFLLFHRMLAIDPRGA